MCVRLFHISLLNCCLKLSDKRLTKLPKKPFCEKSSKKSPTTGLKKNRQNIAMSTEKQAAFQCFCPTLQRLFMEKGLFRQSQWLAFLASGRTWTMIGSRENSKPEKCSIMPHAAKQQSLASSARCTMCWAVSHVERFSLGKAFQHLWLHYSGAEKDYFHCENSTHF